MRKFADALRGELNGLECRSADRSLADESNRWRRRRCEPANRMHGLADGAGRHLVMGRLVLIAGGDGRASWRDAEIFGAVGTKHPGHRHACRVMENRDERLQQNRENGQPSGSPEHGFLTLHDHGCE